MKKPFPLILSLFVMTSCALNGQTNSSSSANQNNNSNTTSDNTNNDTSTSENNATSQTEASSAASSQAPSSRTSMPSFDNLDHVKLFVAKTTNSYTYSHAYAWTGTGNSATPLLGAWPGTALTNYDDNWLTYDFNTQYTTFSLILSVSGSNQNSQAGDSINGVGAYWYYNNALEKNSTMPDLNPQEDTTPDQGNTDDTTTSGEEGNIFHAFNWSLNNIKSKLQEIKDAGYTAIQTSPLQRPKDYSTQWKSINDWWKLYQPLSFDVPTSGTWMGTPSDLQSLTDAAHAKGLKIIVDVVANHMGGNGDNFDGNIGNYEPDIYNNQGETLRKNGQCSDWMNRWDVTHKRMGGYPELNTASTKVQTAVYDYLKQLIDKGVDGFRFDAAKHIETPFDEADTKSDFWTNTAVKAENYASTSKNKDIYMYGEILNETPQIPFNYYTTHGDYKLLDAVTDNGTGNAILAGIKSGNSSSAAKSNYNSGLPASQTVIWGESHDTYMNNDSDPSCSRNVDQDKVDKAYALAGSRKGTRALYFARPSLSTEIGSSATQGTNYKNALIKGVNTLKVAMGNNNEKIASDGDIAYVARYGENGYGATIVRMSGSSNATLTFSDLPDGTYKDLVSGATYTMANHSITVSFNSSYGATVIQKIS